MLMRLGLGLGSGNESGKSADSTHFQHNSVLRLSDVFKTTKMQLVSMHDLEQIS